MQRSGYAALAGALAGRTPRSWPHISEATATESVSLAQWKGSVPLNDAGTDINCMECDVFRSAGHLHVLDNRCGRAM